MAKKRKKSIVKSVKEQINYKNKPFDSLASLKLELKKQDKESDNKANKKNIQKPQIQKNDKEDVRLFFEAMGDVKPLNKKNISVKKPLPIEAWEVPQMPNEDIEVLHTLSNLVSGESGFDIRYIDGYVEAYVKGLSIKIMEQLRSGYIPYQGYLDLHGLTLLQAEAAIVQFILKAVSLGSACVLLIHGQGHRSPQGVSIIKQNLDELLLKGAVKKYILAFTTARPIDGGLGASYVLLRK